jgi:uncharacterized protein (TIGR01244 family)
MSRFPHTPALHLATALLCGLLTIASALPARADTARNPEWATPVTSEHNLYRVTPTFYRSAKLDAASVAQIEQLGVRTVVNLRAFHADDQLLANTGIRMVRVPINTWHIEDEDVIQALRAIRAAEAEGPVLLHCLHGADRTGLVTAMYRVVFAGWSREQALDELEHGGYGYHAMWRNIPAYLKKVDVDKIRLAVNTPEGAQP